jgi:hypothetical protein
MFFKKSKNRLERYREALVYLDSCVIFNEASFRKFNRIAGDLFSEEEIARHIRSAGHMFGGMESIKELLRSNIVEGITTFENLQRQGIEIP